MITLDVTLNDNIEKVKTKIFEKEGISVDSLRLVYNSRVLENCKTLLDYQIVRESTLDMISRLTGD